MCRCMKSFTNFIKSSHYINELRCLEEMRQIMAGPNLPNRQSVFDMDNEELEIFKQEVIEYENKRRNKNVTMKRFEKWKKH